MCRTIYRASIGGSQSSDAGSGGMRVTFHGVRGSTPCHGEEIARYGGNTSCVSLEIPGMDPVLFDLGTGLRYFGQTQPRRRAVPRHLPAQPSPLGPHPGAAVLQAVPATRCSRHDLRARCSPVTSRSPTCSPTRSSRRCSRSTSRCFPGWSTSTRSATTSSRSATRKVMTRLIPHVGHTVGYRVEWGGRSVVYMSDHQMPADGSHSAWPGVLELCADADLLIHDAQYTPEEFETKRDWGHCTLEYAVWLAATSWRQAPRAVPPRSGSRRRRPRHDPRRGDRVRGEAWASRRSPPASDPPSTSEALSSLAVVASVLLGVAFVVAGGSKIAAGRGVARIRLGASGRRRSSFPCCRGSRSCSARC